MLIYVSKRSATISWRGAYHKFSALQTPRWPETALPECSKQEYVQPHFEILPASWSFLDFLAEK